MNTEMRCGQNFMTQNIILGITIVLIVTNVLDTVFTQQILQFEGYIEVNPIADYIIINYGYSVFFVAKMIPLFYLWLIRDTIRVRFITTLYLVACGFVYLNIMQNMMIMNPIIQ